MQKNLQLKRKSEAIKNVPFICIFILKPVQGLGEEKIENAVAKI